MRRWIWLVALLWAVACPALAQTNEPNNSTPTPLDVQQVADLIATAQAAAGDAMSAADAVGERTDHAFNLLGLFEAFGLIVTVAGVTLGAFGFTRLWSAQAQLTETRQKIEADFEAVMEARNAQFDSLEASVLNTTREQREYTANAQLATALLPIGERQYKTQDYEGAINTYKRALELDPSNPVIHQRLGYVYAQSGELELAKYHYEEAIQREENFAPALAGLGFVYRRMGEAIDKTIDQDAADQEQGATTASIRRDRFFTRAEEMLLQALELSPRLVDDDGESWWGVVGGLRKRRGQIDGAIEAYREATIVTPQSSYGFGNLALLYLKKQEVERMRETYQRVERIAAREAIAESGNFWGYADLITSLFAQDKIREAEEALPIAIEIAPVSSPYMLSGLSETLAELIPVVKPETKPAIRQAMSTLDAVRLQREADIAAKEAAARQLAEQTYLDAEWSSDV